ncbi:HAD-IA family hydrolase [Acinetobacter sp. ANC 3882]|uniref:HAD-IA family hydrolase n=1 Tax=Acinetobacter sp. ANC 3882 TaxID=2923423 RepID=UPI001F4A7183|nr:HAD-IA family hydrolase [Acinetobacter sp. ANC 3882]MCH7314656.1 HAD-IA family hydrolase [Acinetobacter sp. ANC 3882]
MIINTFIEKAKRKIAQAEIVSFDIFDTLLLRPYLSPRDLFLHIEIDQCLEGFALARREAELRARKKNPDRQEICYDDIYNEIDIQFKSAKEIELNWEFRLLQPNPEMKILWNYALELKKKVIVISDMYHSFESLEQLLIKNEFYAFEHLYVSSTYGKTKKKGTLFEHVFSDLKVKAQDIVHIGDNKKGDYRAPVKLGIQAILYKQVAQQFLAVDERARRFTEQGPLNLGKSILVAMLALRWLKQSLAQTQQQYWQEIGYAYAAPLAYGYSKWIETTASEKKLDHLLFVARDGYLLQKAFQHFHLGGIKTSYVYAPRLLNLIYRLDYDKRNTDSAKSIVNFYAEKYADIRELAEGKLFNKAIDYHNFIQKYKQHFEAYSAQMYMDYHHYIDTIVVEDERVGVIDSKTVAFTSQKMLEDVLQRPITGFYWSTLLPYRTKKYAFNTFIPNNLNILDTNVFTKNWKFIELLLSSPELPIYGVSRNGQPRYKNDPSKDESVIQKNYAEIALGAESFFTDIKAIFGQTNLYIEGGDLVTWANVFCDYPNRIDVEKMTEIKLAVDISHHSYMPLFSMKISCRDFLKRPKVTLDILKNILWRTPIQSMVLHTFRPIKVKKESSRKIKISLLPYLKIRYFMWTLSLFNKFSFQFSLGNYKKNHF